MVNSDAELKELGGDNILLLVNRALDGDFKASDGIELIRSVHAAGGPKAMLISNYAAAQAAAAAAGVERVPVAGQQLGQRPPFRAGREFDLLATLGGFKLKFVTHEEADSGSARIMDSSADRRMTCRGGTMRKRFSSQSPRSRAWSSSGLPGTRS